MGQSATRLNGQRARATEDKAIRREQLLAAAALLFDARGPREITIAEVARSAGLAKGTVYLYFATKEELFKVKRQLLAVLAHLGALIVLEPKGGRT
jgi:DNA-binding transcriptional regulator YbjK